jgi:hypothetical protein
MTRTRRRFLALAIGIGFGLALNLASAGAVSGGGSKPTWWAKFQHVSDAGFKAASAGSGSSLTVGANVDVSNEAGPQSETSIAINPSNPKEIVAGSNEIDRLPMRGYFSNDGGKSWGGVDLPLPPPLVQNGNRFGSDPGIAWDATGNVYYSYIVVFFGGGFNNGNGVSINGTEMAVARSANGGRTWTAAYFDLQTGEAQFDDKPMITVDTNPGSPHFNTVYAAWDNSNGSSSNSNGVLVARSIDGGKSFAFVNATPTNSGPAGDIGADPFVSPDGTLHVAYSNYLGSTIQMVTSKDGGQTFANQVVTISSDQIGFDIGIPAQNSRRVLEYPACGSDATGVLYCSYIDGSVSTGVDVFVRRSIDGGSIWGTRARASDSTGLVDHFNHWLAVDPSDGSVNVSFYDTRNDPSRVKTEVFYARSTDGGASFAPNVQVANAPSDETVASADGGNQYGDYEGIAAFNGSIHPVWTDGRFDSTLGEEVFTAAITIK